MKNMVTAACFVWILFSAITLSNAIIVDSSSNNGYYSGQVSLSNTTGPMCIEGWTDKAAMVLCKQEHYLTGYKMLLALAHNTIPPVVGKDIVCTGNESSLNECRLTVGVQCAISNGGANYGGGAMCSNSTQGFEIRLKPDTNSRNWGLVEVAFEGVWGTVQADYYNNFRIYDVARLACKQLGYADGSPAKHLRYTDDGGPTWLYGVRDCGVEKKLWKCQISRFNVTTNLKPLLVKCVPPVSLSYSFYNIGHVIWRPNKTENVICADGFSKEEATVVCRQLGFLYGYELTQQYQEYSIKPHSSNITYYHLQCTGLETRIEDCTYHEDLCTNNTTAKVMCSNGGNDTDYKVSLSNDVKKVILTYMGVPGSICADNWTDVSATVVCKEVYGKNDTGGIAYKYDADYFSYILSWKSNIQCIGNETHLSQCPYTSGQQTNCLSRHIAAVYCYSTPGFDIRLVGGNGGSGRVQALVDGEWVRVCCAFDFSYKEANVFCRMLNYTGGNNLPSNAFPRRHNSHQKVMVADVRCTGEEMSVLECTMEIKPREDFCRQDAVVHCTGNANVRLSSTSKSGKYGIPEIYKHDDWYPVCDADFTDDLARLACQELGYQDGVYRCCSPLGYDNRTFVTVNDCDTNSTTSISDCTINIGCSSRQYVTIFCSYHTHLYTESDWLRYKIYLPEIHSFGEVETMFGGENSVICRTNWTDLEANVTCKSKGYDGGIAHYVENLLSSPVLFGNFNCNGTETSLSYCSRNIHNTGCSEPSTTNQQIAGVKCYRNGQVPYVSLNSTDDTDEKSGYALVTIDGVTNNICDRNWGDNEAQVFCRELGYIYGKSITRYHIIDNARWLILGCKGDETSLFLCNHLDSTLSCSPARARCYNEDIQFTYTTKWNRSNIDFMNETNESSISTHTTNVVSHITTTALVSTTTDGELGDTDQQSGLNDKDVTIIVSGVLGAVVLVLGLVLLVVYIKRSAVGAVVPAVTNMAPTETTRL